MGAGATASPDRSPRGTGHESLIRLFTAGKRAVLAVTGTLLSIWFSMPASAESDFPTTFEREDVLVRLRSDVVIPQDSWSSVSLAGKTLSGSKVNVSNDTIPELDVTYFLTQHWSLETYLGTSQHIVSAQTPLGNLEIARTRVLPPFVLGEYHFTQIHGFVPYIGVGISGLVFFDTRPETGPAGQGLVHSVHFRSTVGPAVDAGVDHHLGRRWYMNAVIVQSFAPVQLDINGGGINARTQLNLTGLGLGVGYRF
jgi:outer membrane protein